jgi:hypothetical protein
MAVRQYHGRGGRVLEENVEGVHTLRPGGRYYAVLLNRPGRGLRPQQALATAAAANGVVRAAKLPALLGGADDRLGTDAVSWAVVRLAAGLGSRSLRLGAQKAVAATLRIRFNAKDRTATGFQRVLGMSWGDVWASATGCPAFGKAVEAAVDPETRQIKPDTVVRVVGAVRAGLWDSPVGQTMKRRPMQLRVVPVDTVEVDSAFLTAAVALEWATIRIERDARRLAEVLDDCKTLEDFLDALGARTMAAAGKTAAVQVWAVYSKAREEAAHTAATASGTFDWNKAPCVGKLLDGTLRYELKNDLRFGLAVVLEEAARRRGPGAHARTLFPIESLGALCTEAGPLRRREFTATLKNMARKTPGPLSRCTVIAARTMRGEPGLKCPAASCDACHRAAGIPATTPPEDVTPGMVASFTA